MKIIQSYNTFGGERMSCGMQTLRVLLAHLEKSFPIHNELGDYYLYTDEFGKEAVKDIIPEEKIILFDFKIEYGDKLLYIGKFQVQEIQDEAYIHIDMDELITELPTESDVYFHRYRPANFDKECAKLKMDLRKIGQIPCSNVIGFSDISFKNKYIKEARKWIEKAAKNKKISYQHAWLAEEAVLQNMIVKHKKTVSTIV